MRYVHVTQDLHDNVESAVADGLTRANSPDHFLRVGYTTEATRDTTTPSRSPPRPPTKDNASSPGYISAERGKADIAHVL